MVNNMKSSIQTSRGGAAVGRQSPSKDSKLSKEVIFVRAAQRVRAPLPPQPAGFRLSGATPRSIREADIEEEADDVIDLGAPRRLRRRPSADLTPAPRPATRRALLPNPRLYPGPKSKPKPAARRTEAARARRGKRTLRRPVPNSRLYRPGPPRPPAPPPPPARPRAAWPPPAPPRALDTASRAALRLGARASSPRFPAAAPTSPPPPARASSPAAVERARRLVVTLPAAAARYRPASEHFRARVAPDAGSGASTPPAARLRPRGMDPPSGHSASPEDRSEGNETLSAPSEFLAEFLSAIMRRQYAEALKYCRLILQYEPHNATARGFYPLLRTKVARAQRTDTAADGADSSSDEAAADADADAGRSSAGDSPSLSRQEEDMSHSAEDSEEGGEQSELELDSSDALHSSPSLSLSRRTERTERTDSASAGCWESSASGSRSEPGAAADDNGNAAPAPPPLLPDDLENDNAPDAGSGEPHHSTRLKSQSQSQGAGETLSPLQRLRAQFACSIK